MYVKVSCKAWSFARNSNITNCPKWPNLSPDRRFCIPRNCFAVFCRKLRISTLTYYRHPPSRNGPAKNSASPAWPPPHPSRTFPLLPTQMEYCPSAACDLWRRRTDRWPCCLSLSNPSGIDLCIAWRFWMTTIERLLNTCPEI